MALKLITAPTKEPITLDEAKNHLRVDGNDEDALIANLIAAAREIAENFTGRALMPQSFEYILDDFPRNSAASENCIEFKSDNLNPIKNDLSKIRMPKPPTITVNSIKYTDSTGTVNTWDSTNYLVDYESEPCRIAPKTAGAWPSFIPATLNAVRINFTCGYAEGTLPKSIIQAIKLIVGHLYENREAVNIGWKAREMPFGAKFLLASYRIYRWEQ